MPKDDFFLLITIETLASTKFDLVIHKEARVKDMKRQIRYYTHIPVEEQHLLLGEVELKDSYSLADYHIVYGTTIKLVTGMRGGPISYRPVNTAPPLLSLMALLRNKPDKRDDDDSDDSQDFSDFSLGDDYDELNDSSVAYFVAHEGKLIQVPIYPTSIINN